MVSVVIDKKSTKRKWIVILCELSMKQNRIAEKKKIESNDKKNFIILQGPQGELFNKLKIFRR